MAVTVIAVSLITIPLLPSSFSDRMSSIIHPEEDRTGLREARKRLLREAYQAYLDNPVFELGPASPTTTIPAVGRKLGVSRTMHGFRSRQNWEQVEF